MVTATYPTHADVRARLAEAISLWALAREICAGTVFAGDVWIQLAPAATAIRVDAVFLPPSAPGVVLTDERGTSIRAVPTLAAVLLRPGHTFGELAGVVRQLGRAGVQLVWMIDTEFRTVTVHQPSIPIVMRNRAHDLDGGDALPGFRVPVARLFPG